MAEEREQWAYLVAFVVALVALPEGAIALWSHPIIGVILGLGGMALMILSLAGLLGANQRGP